MHYGDDTSAGDWPPAFLSDILPPHPPEIQPAPAVHGSSTGATSSLYQPDEFRSFRESLRDEMSGAVPTGFTMPAWDSLGLINLLTGLVEYRDPYFRGASSFTRHLATSIGRHIGLSEDALVCLAYAALLRDVGRMTLNGVLIPATASITSDDRYRIEQHVSLGLELMEVIDLPAVVQEAIRHHHEQWNGTGYPDGLRGEQIPMLSRIIGVADSFAAMISARPYRPPKRFDEAVREIQEGAGRLYDPKVVDALIAVISTHEYRTTGFGLHDYVLIVHPERPRAAQLALELCSRGYLPEVAPDIAAARARMPGIPVGAVLLAGSLPDRDRAAFIEHVRGFVRYRDIPILVFDLRSSDDRVGMLRAGANASFPAEFQLDELLETLGAALSRTRLLQEPAVREAWESSLHWGATVGDSAAAKPSYGGFSGLQGNLTDFPLSWLLQTMQYDGRGAVVTVHSEGRTGSITLHNGILYNAVTEQLSGEAAFTAILDWTEGVFHVQPSTNPGPRTIERGMIHIMLEHAAHDDEKRTLFGAVTNV